jgi:hypothetical protein
MFRTAFFSRQFIARSMVRFTFVGRGMECRVSNVALRYVGSSRGFFCVGTGALSGCFLFENYIEQLSKFRVFVLLWLVSAGVAVGPPHPESQPKMVGNRGCPHYLPRKGTSSWKSPPTLIPRVEDMVATRGNCPASRPNSRP